MTIGGTDIVLDAPPGVPVAAILLRLLKSFWPEAVFQDQNEQKWYPLDHPRVTALGGQSTDFLIFRDEAAARSWDRFGLTRKNANHMLNFIIGNSQEDSTKPIQFTLVCNERTPELNQLINDIVSGVRAKGMVPSSPIS
jgi:hypothetical protein